MRKVFIGAAAIAIVAYVTRGMGERAMRECETMYERMPEDFPPKRMLRGIDEIREQNTRILRQLEKLEQAQRPPAAVAAD